MSTVAVVVALATAGAALVVIRSLTGRGEFNRQVDVHYLGADVASVAAVLNPNVVTSAVWFAASILALYFAIRSNGASRSAGLALTLCFMASPLAWDAFRPGSSWALNPLIGIGLMLVTVASLHSRISPIWMGVATALAVVINPTNLIGILVPFVAACASILPWFRGTHLGTERIRSVGAMLGMAASTVLGAATALAVLSVVYGPLAPQYAALASPLSLGDVSNQMRLPLQGGILSSTAAAGGSPMYPLPFVVTVGLWWICAGGLVAAVIVRLNDRRWRSFLVSLTIVAIVGGPVTAFVLSRIAGAHFGLTGLATGALVTMFLIAASFIARHRGLNVALALYGGGLFLASFVWAAAL